MVVAGDGASSLQQARVLGVHDLASGPEPYVVDLDGLAKDGERSHYQGGVGSTLVVLVQRTDGTVEGRLVSPEANGTEQRPMAGLPADLTGFRVTDTTSATAVLTVSAGPEGARRYTGSILDVASGGITDDFRRENPSNSPPVTVSVTHATWADETDPGRPAVVARRTGGTGEVRLTTVESYQPFGLLDGWLVHGRTTRPGTLGVGGPLRAERVDGIGDSVWILDTMGWLVPGPDGSLLARGGSLTHGEGLYRIAVGEAGLPVAELIATTGEPSVLMYGGADVPATIDLDRSKGADLRWKVSRPGANARVTITRTDGPRYDEPVVIRDLARTGPDAVGFR
ncbi:hypothetical protein ACHGLA_00840 [Streptomyces sp. YH02]|uniref:hypothetical protein n=1 Tax=Streptomyces sp. YH02 TaxID=3256999 RepID=UPI0037573EB1